MIYALAETGGVDSNHLENSTPNAAASNRTAGPCSRSR